MVPRESSATTARTALLTWLGLPPAGPIESTIDICVYASNSRAITAGGPVRVLASRLERAGYHVTEIRSPSHILLAVTGSRPGRKTEPALAAGPLTVLEGVTAGRRAAAL
jgi:hypothetical protein